MHMHIHVQRERVRSRWSMARELCQHDDHDGCVCILLDRHFEGVESTFVTVLLTPDYESLPWPPLDGAQESLHVFFRSLYDDETWLAGAAEPGEL